MIFGDIKNWEKEKEAYSKSIIDALDYIKNTNFSKLENGKHLIDGDNMFAKLMEVETKQKDEARPETHENYIDIQYLISGEEVIGYAKRENVTRISENFLDTRDVIFYQDVDGEIELEMNPGNYAIFFPSDVHRPACQRNRPQKIRKVVVKIRVSAL